MKGADRNVRDNLGQRPIDLIENFVANKGLQADLRLILVSNKFA